jgi:hypothetical protein
MKHRAQAGFVADGAGDRFGAAREKTDGLLLLS